MSKPVTFLSLGPGDPEHLTLKAVRTLREADAILMPATPSADGLVRSRAQEIVNEWADNRKQHLYPLPMQKNRAAAMAVYDHIYRDAAAMQRDGQQVVVAVEGDVSIYASVHYVMDRLQSDGIPVVQCPGIPSFIAAAAQAGLSLASQQQRLTVLPGDADADTLQTLLAANHVVVVMKLSQCQQALKTFLSQCPATVCHYFENVGTTDAFHTTDRDTILSRQIPYFSLCILYPA
jgi:precorrin-2/cobalt-factor-2 C20-methyltransferase